MLAENHGHDEIDFTLWFHVKGIIMVKTHVVLFNIEQYSYKQCISLFGKWYN